MGIAHWEGREAHREGFSLLFAVGLVQEYHISLRYSGSHKYCRRNGGTRHRGMRMLRLPRTSRRAERGLESPQPAAIPCSCWIELLAGPAGLSLCPEPVPAPSPLAAHPPPCIHLSGGAHPCAHLPSPPFRCDQTAWWGLSRGCSQSGTGSGALGRCPGVQGVLGALWAGQGMWPCWCWARGLTSTGGLTSTRGLTSRGAGWRCWCSTSGS